MRRSIEDDIDWLVSNGSDEALSAAEKLRWLADNQHWIKPSYRAIMLPYVQDIVRQTGGVVTMVRPIGKPVVEGVFDEDRTSESGE